MTRNELAQAIETVRRTLDRLIRLHSDNIKAIMHTQQYLALLLTLAKED